MSRKINKSWDTRRDEVHSPEGVVQLRENIKYGLSKKYKGLAESMFAYRYPTKCSDMRVMSQDTVPEIFLLKNGQCVWFELYDQLHCLPLTYNGATNIYGKMSEWSPVPVGYNDTLKGTYSSAVEEIRNLKLNAENSVIMRNDLFGGNDEAFIDAMITELVDNTLTLNQLQLLAKSPFIFSVTEDNMVSAKNFFLALSSDRPAIFVNANGDRTVPSTEKISVPIDPTLLELFDIFECQILEYLGFPCVPITKRAQQTMFEVQSNDDKIRIRRLEKYNQRKNAVDRINEMFGTDMEVYSVIDEYLDNDKESEENDETVESDIGQDTPEQR